MRRYTVGRMLILVTVVAVCLAIARRHLSLAGFAFGVLTLTVLRTCELIERGMHLSRGRWVSLILGSLAIATLIVAVCTVVGVVVFEVAGGGYDLHWRHGGTINTGAVLLGISAAYGTCTLLRRMLWTYPHPPEEVRADDSHNA